MIAQLVIVVLTILILILIIAYYCSRFRRRHPVLEDKIVIHAIFIAKENILFLQEWLDYHIYLGVDYFYLYDNSKVTKKDGFDAANSPLLNPGKQNKYGLNYDQYFNLSAQDIQEMKTALMKKYKNYIQWIDWEPLDESGNVCYNQVEGITKGIQSAKKQKAKWFISIDMDEYIVCPDMNLKKYLKSIPDRVANIIMQEKIYEARSLHLDKRVMDIDKHMFKQWAYAPKSISRVSATNAINVHEWKGEGEQMYANDVFFCHYKWHQKDDNTRSEKIIPDWLSTKIKVGEYASPEWKMKYKK